MTDLKSQFRFMLAYRFRNQHGFVRTAWLDTFDRNFKNKSGTETYTLYQRVANQYFNYQMTLIESDSALKRINSVIQKLLQSYAINQDYNEVLINITINDYLKKYNDSNNRFHNNSYEPLIYIRYQIDDFNHFIKNLSGLLNLNIFYPVPRHFTEIKKVIPKPIETWYERTPILTHRKGYRGFVKDYEYVAHW